MDEARDDLRRGQFIVIRPWQLHAIGAPHVGSSRLVWILPDPGLRRPSEPWRWPDRLVFSPDEARRLGRR